MRQIKKIIVTLVSLSLMSNVGYAVNSKNDSSKATPPAVDPKAKQMYENAVQQLNKTTMPTKTTPTSKPANNVINTPPKVNNYGNRGDTNRRSSSNSSSDNGSQPKALSSDKVILNFENSDVQSVIKAISQLSGKNFVVDPKVKGTINIVSERPISKSDSYKVLESALRMLGFATVEADGVIKVLPEPDAKGYGMQTSVEGAKFKAKSSNPGDQVITRVFVLQHGSANNLANTLRPLIATNNSIVVYQNSNALVVTDYASNMTRIAKIIHDLITPVGNIEPIVITFKHAIAADVAQVLQSFLQGGSSGGGGYSGGGSYSGGGGNYSSGGSGGGGGYSGGGGADAPAISITVNPQNNSIILHSSSRDKLQEAKEKIQELKALALKMDHATGQSNAFMHVVYLKNADAQHVAEVLRVVATSQENPDLTGSSIQSKFVNEPSGVFQGSGGGGGMGGGSSAFGGGGGGGAFGGGGNRPGGNMGGGANRGGMGNNQQAGGQNQQNMPKIFIQAEPTTNSLIIQAPDAMYRNLRMIIDMLDVRRAQVLIEAMVVDVNQSTSGTFGIQWLVAGGNNNVGGATVANYGVGPSSLSGIATSIATAAQGATGNQTSGAQGINIPNSVFVGLVTGTTTIGGQTIPNLGALAEMISATSSGNILARPTLITLDNEEAKIQVGSNIGIPNGSFQNSANQAGNLVTTVTRQDLGTFLQIKPKITQNGSIQLDLYLEDSKVDPNQTSNQAILAQQGPSFLKRNMRATILVDDGQIIALGGMTTDTISIVQNGVPILSSIPYLGWLFSWQSRSHRKDNLVLFLRPVVIRNAEGSKALSNQRYQYVLDRQNSIKAKGNLLLPNINAVNLDNQVSYDNKVPPQPDKPVTDLPIVDVRASAHKNMAHKPTNGAKASVRAITTIPAYNSQSQQKPATGAAPGTIMNK
jgi:general secretion pathway protein D